MPSIQRELSSANLFLGEGHWITPFTRFVRVQEFHSVGDDDIQPLLFSPQQTKNL
jgi:hypothetical protein